MSNQPSVSVVVATRDRPAMAARALRSIAAQRFQDYEVIVVDDGSTPEALAEYRTLMESLGPGFRLDSSVPSGSPGSGPAAVRNRGILRSEGRYVAFLDDDDWWTAEDHLELAVEALSSQKSDFYFADIQGIRSERIELTTWYPNPPQDGAQLLSSSGELFRLDHEALVKLFRHHMIHPDCWVVARDLLVRLHGFNERLRFVEDFELGMRIADAAASIIYRARPVALYRLPDGDAESLKYDRLTIQLQYSLAAQTLRTACKSRKMRRCARARESYSLRQIGAELLAKEQSQAARSFFWQALMTFPTPGSLADLVSSLAGRRT